MYDKRAVGHVKGPTPDQVARYAARHHLELTPAELEGYAEIVSGAMEVYNRVDELDEPSIPLKYPYRDPGRTPRAGEDPYNAFIRFCEVRGADTGPLAGKKIGVKDCIAVAGIPQTYGGRRLPYAVPTEDAVVVERILDAGATIVGKTNMEDLALGVGEGSFFGASRNPRNPAYSTGGSSSGSGAAVAAGLVDMALGADEAGSVRIPAAWCGIVGMKATHGLVPSYGMTYMDHTIDHIGPMTTTVYDNALLLEVMAGGDWRDPQWVRADPTPGNYTVAAGRGIEGLRIGVVSESLEPTGCSPGTLNTFASAQKTLMSLGAEIIPVNVPLWTDCWSIEMGVLNFGLWAMAGSLGQGYGHMGRVDVNLLATSAAHFRQQAKDLPLMLRVILITVEHMREAYQGVHFGKAQNLRLELRRQVDAALADVDLLITPTTPSGPFELLDRRATDEEMAQRAALDSVLNTCPLDLSGHPALTVPSGSCEGDLPTGLQIIGPRFGEELVYQAGFAFEGA
jgi:amidase